MDIRYQTTLLPSINQSSLSYINSNNNMAPILDNEAAWIKAFKAYPLEVGPGPQPDPTENEVVIKVAYAAANPLDWKVSGTLVLDRLSPDMDLNI